MVIRNINTILDAGSDLEFVPPLVMTWSLHYQSTYTYFGKHSRQKFKLKLQILSKFNTKGSFSQRLDDLTTLYFVALIWANSSTVLLLWMTHTPSVFFCFSNVNMLSRHVTMQTNILIALLRLKINKTKLYLNLLGDICPKTRVILYCSGWANPKRKCHRKPI